MPSRRGLLTLPDDQHRQQMGSPAATAFVIVLHRSVTRPAAVAPVATVRETLAAMFATGVPATPATWIGPPPHKLVAASTVTTAGRLTAHLPSGVPPSVAVAPAARPIFCAILSRVQFAPSFGVFCWARSCAAVNAEPASAFASASRESRT